MSARQIRRAAERKARKSAVRQTGLPVPPSVIASTPATLAAAAGASSVLVEENTETAVSPARLAANQANAQHSTGPKSEATKAISSQNHTVHGLTRHKPGTFKLLATEDPLDFEALKQSLLNEHAPATATEFILVKGMAESHWLAARAQHLQDTCMDPNTGVITDDKKFCLYLRYQTTHTRAFHKNLSDLLKLRAERRKAELGFEAQQRKLASQTNARGREMDHEIDDEDPELDFSSFDVDGFIGRYQASLRERHYSEEQIAVFTQVARDKFAPKTQSQGL